MTTNQHDPPKLDLVAEKPERDPLEGSAFYQELEPQLLDAVDRGAAEPESAPAGASAAPPASFGPHSVLKYAVVEGAERYRRIMHVLAAENRNFGLRLSPGMLGSQLQRAFELELDHAALDSHLQQLHTWGAVERELDTSMARTARELKRERFTYDITPAAKRTEELLDELDRLVESVGSLDAGRLTQILEALRRMARILAGDGPDPALLQQEFERLLDAITRLHGGASDFMSRLNVVIARSEQIDERDFAACKSTLIEHVQGFRRALRRTSDDIVEAVDRVEALGPERMVAIIVGAMDLPALPGVTREQVEAQRHADLLDQWKGLRRWFVEEEGRRSPWQSLNSKVIEAIRAILDIAERIVDRVANRADRAKAFERLARLAHDAPVGRDYEVLALALGLSVPRHVGAPADPDVDLVREPGRTSWAEAPAAPVKAHLRRPGARAPGAGRGKPIPDDSDLRRRVRERIRAERQELERALARFEGRGRVRLSELSILDEVGFRHLLAWIGRAFESPADANGTRRASSQDGRAEIRLTSPSAGEPSVTITTDHGRFTTRNYGLEVKTR